MRSVVFTAIARHVTHAPVRIGMVNVNAEPPPTRLSTQILPPSTDQVDAVAVLVRQRPPAVDLLLVDPAVAVERLADERGLHR